MPASYVLRFFRRWSDTSTAVRTSPAVCTSHAPGDDVSGTESVMWNTVTSDRLLSLHPSAQRAAASSVLSHIDRMWESQSSHAASTSALTTVPFLEAAVRRSTRSPQLTSHSAPAPAPTGRCSR